MTPVFVPFGLSVVTISWEKVMGKNLLAGVLSAAALGATLVMAPSAAASTAGALACHGEFSTPADGGFATLVSGKMIPVRSGPYADCSFTNVPAGSELSLDCKDFNDVDNLWYHGSVWANGRDVTGWVYSANIAKIYESNGAWCT